MAADALQEVVDAKERPSLQTRHVIEDVSVYVWIVVQDLALSFVFHWIVYILYHF